MLRLNLLEYYLFYSDIADEFLNEVFDFLILLYIIALLLLYAFEETIVL